MLSCGSSARHVEPRANSGWGAIVQRATGEGRPTLAVVARDGDVRGAIALAVTTDGIDTDRGALVPVALAALVQQRMQARGIDAVAMGSWSGWRLHAVVASPMDAASVVVAARAALLTPVGLNDPAMPTVLRKADALAQRPLHDAALADVARCTGEPYGSFAARTPSFAELEAWRAAAHGLGRIAVAVAGASALSDAAANALERAPPWPVAAPLLVDAWPPMQAQATVYDASGELPPGDARIIVTARTPAPERAVVAAAALGSAHGALASRLAALDAPGQLRAVIAAAHGDGGCLAATIDLDGREFGSDFPASIATAAALARQELAVELADATPPPNVGRDLAMRASDPRDAAERAAWWSLAGRRSDVSDDETRIRITVGVASARDAAELSATTRASAIVAEIDRATLAWHAAIVESRTRVESGQGETWILLASPCGTLPESADDAGIGAAVALAAAEQAQAIAGDARVEPLVAPDAIGLFVHGPPRPSETPQAQARRLADVVARAFAAEGLEPEQTAKARARLLLQASQVDARTNAALASALAPGHPSWIEPGGTLLGMASASDELIAMRAAAIRAGPLRVAVLANDDLAQADAAVHAIDRWIARRPGESRTCPAIPAAVLPRSGTYSIDRPAGAPSEAILAIPLPLGEEPTRTATWLAATLDGDDGMLAHALGGARHEAPLARTWNATVVGVPRAPALAIRVSASDDALDMAVAQARALIDRVRQGALGEADRTRAAAAIEGARLTSLLDPSERALELWRGAGRAPAPSLEALRSFSASVLRDEALVIVAARPPRIVRQTTSTSPGRASKTR
jgi:hypothetical protein